MTEEEVSLVRARVMEVVDELGLVVIGTGWMSEVEISLVQSCVCSMPDQGVSSVPHDRFGVSPLLQGITSQSGGFLP